MITFPSSLRAASTLAIAATVLTLPAPALAGWESIIPAGTPNLKDECGRAGVRASDNRPLRVAAGSTIDIEVLGHGIDLVGNADFDFDGGDVSPIRRYNGFENVARKCGAIGSVKVRLRIDRANPENGAPTIRNHILRIGNDRIRVTVMLPGDFRSLSWDRESFSTGNGASARASGGSLPRSAPITVGSGQSCQQTQTCGGGGTSGFMVIPEGPGGGSRPSELSANLWSCIAARGGEVRLNGDRLEILLPDDRNAVRDCIINPSFARVAQFYPYPLDFNVIAEPQTPAMRYSLRGAQGATAQPGSDPQTVRFALTRDFAMRMVGVHDFNLVATNFAARQRSLDVRVKSVVPYGVTRIAPVNNLVGAINTVAAPVTANAGPTGRRSNVPVVPSVAFDIDLAPSDAAARPLVWSIQGGNGCFTQNTGRLTPAPGERRIRLTVPRTSATACNGSNIGIAIAPESRTGVALYTASATITLR